MTNWPPPFGTTNRNRDWAMTFWTNRMPQILSLATKAELYARLRRFRKYGIFYVIRENEVRLIAIHHGARDPRWLQDRKKQVV